MCNRFFVSFIILTGCLAGEKSSHRSDPIVPAENPSKPSPPADLAPPQAAPLPAPVAQEEPSEAPVEIKTVRLRAVGDILFGRYVNNKIRRVAKRPLADIADLLQDADITFGNVECPVMVEPKTFTTFQKLTFRAEPEDADTLKEVGFDVVSIANNHTLNLGWAGAGQTKENVEARGIITVGAGDDQATTYAPRLTEVNGMRILFLARTTWLNGRTDPTSKQKVAYIEDGRVGDLAPEIAALRASHRADIVIVSLHWGIEDRDQPMDSQRQAAHALIDSGADLILGHHPHVVQPIERYKQGLIAYSLGNFLFDNPKLTWRQTIILEVVLSSDPKRPIGDIKVIPAIIANPNGPRKTGDLKWVRKLRTVVPEDAIVAPAE